MRRFAILAVLAVMVTACGDDAPPTSPSARAAVLPPAPTATPTPVRVGGNIQDPRKTKHVQPVYPAEARQQRIQGIVVLELTIDTSGRVRDIRVAVSVHPLLDNAAIDAVSQWEYEPALLNGVPVPVIMTVTVNFTLQ